MGEILISMGERERAVAVVPARQHQVALVTPSQLITFRSIVTHLAQVVRITGRTSMRAIATTIETTRSPETQNGTRTPGPTSTFPTSNLTRPCFVNARLGSTSPRLPIVTVSRRRDDQRTRPRSVSTLIALI
uniref:Uncharacterized protein n=1 Tax=Cacopsylla melanoneura TaxID=428564 RepID=A0A8D8ZN21_9HEMI